MKLEQARFNMVQQQVRTWDVLDQDVLDTLQALPRHEFVPEAYRAFAYADIQVPLGEGQVMMHPKVEARMLQELHLRPTDRVLEIGTGSGYVCALLSRLAGMVYSVEISPALAESARRRLEAHGIANVSLKVGDGYHGWADHAPYEAIAVTGSVPEVPNELRQQLALGGRLFVVVGQPPVMEAVLVTRVGKADWARDSLFDTELPALLGAPTRAAFVF
jgi:protein-L-isoaspartate(D-aspartate) O-methyltransferase